MDCMNTPRTPDPDPDKQIKKKTRYSPKQDVLISWTDAVKKIKNMRYSGGRKVSYRRGRGCMDSRSRTKGLVLT